MGGDGVFVIMFILHSLHPYPFTSAAVAPLPLPLHFWFLFLPYSLNHRSIQSLDEILFVNLGRVKAVDRAACGFDTDVLALVVEAIRAGGQDNDVHDVNLHVT